MDLSVCVYVCFSVCMCVKTCDFHYSRGANQSAALCCLLLQPNVWAQECTRERPHLQQACVWVCMYLCVCVCVCKKEREVFAEAKCPHKDRKAARIFRLRSFHWQQKEPLKPVWGSCGRNIFSKVKLLNFLLFIVTYKENVTSVLNSS